MMMKANPAETLEQFKQDFPVILPIRVAWGEMDAFQHVNNVSYIRYFESARIAYMEAMGMEANIKTSPVGPILGDIYCRYRRPVTYPDTLHVGTKISEINEFGFVMEYQAFSEKQNTVATLGHCKIVMIDYRSNQKVAVEGEMLDKILTLQPDLG
ncbi:acyl-CoA thioesterase [Kangiella geojedonensis]|uniref:Thioesterase superfamily protein n=1 Tax=Kangiella geojedonensis TaxID=914150 RepID=A0A0F6TRR0_9GAMM|nr:thioesterase family protein [Kangiella geojedonensis]AKE52610.1 Thioesterase superfamily protein [Kangiella geojedonensis]